MSAVHVRRVGLGARPRRDAPATAARAPDRPAPPPRRLADGSGGNPLSSFVFSRAMTRLIGVLSLVPLALAFAACGGKSESEKEREAEAKSGRGTVTCSGKAMTGATGLPADFPDVEGV